MKKFFVIAAMMVAAVSANAQFEPGTFSIQPKLGGVGSMLSNMSDYEFNGIKADKTANGGGIIGAEAEYQLMNMLSLAAGVNYSMQGTAWEDISFLGVDHGVDYKDRKIELGYITVPIVANIYLFRGFAVKTGAQFGFLTNASYKLTKKTGSTTVETDEDMKDQFEKFDFSIPVGVSYQFKVPIVIDARYNIGLTNVVKHSDESYKNQVFQITVGYKFKL